MRAALLLLLLACPALAQDLAAESARNQAWSKAAGEAEKEAAEATETAKKIADRLKRRKDRLTELISQYGSVESSPEREFVVERMKALDEALLSVEREQRELRARATRAQRALAEVAATTAEWEAKLDDNPSNNSDAGWKALREAREAIVKRWVDAATQRKTQLDAAILDLAEIRDTIARTRYTHQLHNLTMRGPNYITWAATRDAVEDLPALASWVRDAVVETTSYFSGAAARAAALRWLVTSGLAILLALAAGLGLRRYAQRSEAAGADAMQQKVYRAIAQFGRRAIHLALIYLIPESATAILPDLPPEVVTYLEELAKLFGISYLVWALYRELLRPDKPERALVAIEPWARRRISLAVHVLLLFAIAALPLAIGLRIFGYGNVGAAALLDAIVLVVTAAVLSGIVFRRRLFAELLPKADATWGRLVRAMALLLRPFLLLLMPAIAILSLARFELLASELTRWSAGLLGSIIATALLYQVAKALALAWAHKAYGKEAMEPESRGAVTAAALLFALRTFFFLFGVWALATLVGSSTRDLILAIDIPLPFQTGESPTTYWDVCASIALLCFFVFGTRHAKDLLQHQVLERTGLDRSTQYTIATLSGYVVLAIGIVAAVRQVFNLSDLGTIVAALSVGIGFGLQEIVSNFISGIVLLFERPIRVGDTIEVGTNRGLIRQINMRATTVQTRDNIFILVPNRDLMTHTVVNYGYDDPKIRLRIPVGVSYGSDPEQVKEVLLKVAADTEKVLRYPTPQVQFIAFGDSSLNFDLLPWIQRPEQAPAITSAINFAIFAAFKEAGIQIPFPQRDIHVYGEPKPPVVPDPEPGEDRTD